MMERTASQKPSLDSTGISLVTSTSSVNMFTLMALTSRRCFDLAID